MARLKTHDAILREAVEFLRDEVSPRANEIDIDLDALKWALDGFCKRDLMALRRPAEYGGPGFSEPMFRDFQEAVARFSGSLAFLQTQHQSAASMIAKGDNEPLKQATLPMMGNGERLIGIGFSQLRRPGPPMLTASKKEGGYELNGSVPWVTGFGLFGEFLIGASLKDERAVFGVVPFVPTWRLDGEISFTEPMRLAAMESPQTVSAHLTDFFLPDEDVAFIKPAGWIQNNDMINITLQGFFALGCARAGLDQLLAAYEKKQSPFIMTAYDALDRELTACRNKTIEVQESGDEEVTTNEKLKIRAWAIDLAVRCAHAGVTAHSGAANSSSHPAQRVYREALVYTVSAQTTGIMQATLERLVGRGVGV
jgi:alkylation response protein AidB-like acyl-CoA dehydrogenase